MEHQLKLHIESVEDRIEELEREMDKKEKIIECNRRASVASSMLN